jgi:translation initiation factor 2-alpha kinase 4
MLATLRATFRRHGASPLSSRAVTWARGGGGGGGCGGGGGGLSGGGDRLLSRSGALVALRRDLRSALVQQAAAEEATSLRASCVGITFRSTTTGGGGGGLPREHVQADFDIIAPRESTDGAIAEAEMIKCTWDAMVERGLSPAVALNHRRVLAAAWERAGVPPEARPRVAAMLRRSPSPRAAAGAASGSIAIAGVLSSVRLPAAVVTRTAALHALGAEEAVGRLHLTSSLV